LLIVCLFQIGLMGCGAQEPNYTIASWHYVFKNPATPDHLIPVEIYYPSESRLNGFPLMVFGHCSQCHGSWYTYQYTDIVPYGYVIAYLDSYQYLGNCVEFSRDQRYVLDALKQENEDRLSKLYQKIGNVSFAGGHSMGGGASMLSLANYDVNQTFNYSFDAMITLSGCGGLDVRYALPNITKPSFLISGSKDCICEPYIFSDAYYYEIPIRTCKFLGVITNATHCQMAGIPERENSACNRVEDDLCPFKNHQALNESVQHSIVNKYVLMWLNAIGYDDSSIESLDNIANTLTNDLEDHILTFARYDCKVTV